MVAAPSTPRRSTRGMLFSPSPHPTPSTSSFAKNTTYAWTSAPLAPFPLPSSSSSPALSREEKGRTRYNSYTRIVSRTGQTPSKPLGGKKVRAGKGDEESRFTVGDGVLVSVQGGDEGVGVLTALWEEEADGQNEEQEEDSGDEDEPKEKDEGPRMMAEIHWAFRKQDLPGVMKNVKVEDNEVLLAASTTARPVTSTLPIFLLSRTIPIYSRQFFRDQFPETKTQWKGWAYVRPTGVYWCHRALDKFAKGGKVWKVDIDEWREGGKKGLGWDVPAETQRVEVESEEEGEGSDEDEEGSIAGSGEESDDDEDDDEEEEEEDVDETAFNPNSRKRKRRTTTSYSQTKRGAKPKTKGRTKSKAQPAGATPSKTRRPTKRLPHPKSSASNLPSSVLSADQLPVDPYQRALRLLHVGATPESLPCREEEFVDVLSRVEEGVEGGGGGCLYIAGVPGTGKTATVHAVVKELKRKAEDGELPPFSYVEINGLKIPSPQHAYTVLWEAISGAKGVSAKTALRGLEGHFGRKGGGVRGPRGHTYVVLMDELDQLLSSKQDVVYNFFNWPTMRDSQLFVIAVANRMDLPQHLAAKIRSRVGLQTILFQPYDRTSLISIVQSRLIPHPKAPSTDPKVLLPDAIALAATKMAGTNGDARRVLDACRRAVEVAIESGSSTTSAPAPATGTSGVQLKKGANGESAGVGKKEHPHPHPVTAKEMMAVLNAMSASPVARFIASCSVGQKVMLASLVRCIRREGVPEVEWRNLRTDVDALSRALAFESSTVAATDVAVGAGAHGSRKAAGKEESAAAAAAVGVIGVGGDVLLSNSELAIVLSSLQASHALVASTENHKALDERKVALGLEVGEVGRVLMNQGEAWRRALAGV